MYFMGVVEVYNTAARRLEPTAPPPAKLYKLIHYRILSSATTLHRWCSDVDSPESKLQ